MTITKNKKTTLETSKKIIDNGTFKEDMEELKDKATSSLESPSEMGSYSVSGSNPDPDSDDDVLENAHNVGIAPDADFENPKELNIAKNINEAERSRKDG